MFLDPQAPDSLGQLLPPLTLAHDYEVTVRVLEHDGKSSGKAEYSLLFDEPADEQQLKFPRNYSAPPQKGVTNGPEHRGSSLQTRAGDDPERL